MKLTTIALSLSVALLWSISVIIQKYTLQYLPFLAVFIFHSIIYSICTMILFLYNKSYILYHLKNNIYNTKLILFSILGVILGLFIPNLINIYLLKNNKSFIIVALTYTTPLFSLLLAYLLLKEEISLKEIIGVLFIVLGVIIIATSRHNEKFSLIDKFNIIDKS